MWRRVSSADRLAADLWFGAVLVGLVLAAAVGELLLPLLPVCALRAWTGLPCPTCGTARALFALLGGEPLAAVLWNPLSTVAMLVAAAGGLIAPVWVRLARIVPVIAGPRPLYLAVVVAFVVLANWVWLILSGSGA